MDRSNDDTSIGEINRIELSLSDALSENLPQQYYMKVANNKSEQIRMIHFKTVPF